MERENFTEREGFIPVFLRDRDIRAGWVNLYAGESAYAPRTMSEAGACRSTREIAERYARNPFGRKPYARVRIIPKKPKE